MAKTYRGICLRDTTFSDGENTLHLRRGEEYLLSGLYGDDKVTVLSRCWVYGVSRKLFASLLPGPGSPHDTPPTQIEQGAGENVAQHTQPVRSAHSEEPNVGSA